MFLTIQGNAITKRNQTNLDFVSTSSCISQPKFLKSSEPLNKAVWTFNEQRQTSVLLVKGCSSSRVPPYARPEQTSQLTCVRSALLASLIHAVNHSKQSIVICSQRVELASPMQWSVPRIQSNQGTIEFFNQPFHSRGTVIRNVGKSVGLPG